MRAFFAEGVEKMHIPWAVEGLPMLLHLSVFLFFVGLAIFLFNVDREVFGCVICWIGLFSVVYGFITLLPIVRQDSPYHSPLSTPAWFLYASIHYVTFKIFASITSDTFGSYETWRSCNDLRERYRGWILGGVEKIAEETASERSSKIDVQILDWTTSALDDDDSLKELFETIPRSFDSKMLKHLKTDISSTLRRKISGALYGFCDRTLSSNSISDSEKVRRLDIANNARKEIGESYDLFFDTLCYRLGVPQTVEMGHVVARWGTNNAQNIDAIAKGIIAGILVNVRERNDSWVTLAARVFGLPERDLRDYIALGADNVLLAILIHYARRFLRPGYPNTDVLEALSKLDVRNTVPRLQHDFCTLWNEIVQEARARGRHRGRHSETVNILETVKILRDIRHAYIALHQGTDAAPTAFSASTDYFDSNLKEPSSYPICNLASHRPDSAPHFPVPLLPPHSPEASSYPPTDGGNTASRQAEQVNKAVEPPSSSNSTTTSEIGATSHGPDITPSTNLVHSSSHALPTAGAPQNITSTATLSLPLEGSEQLGSEIVAHAPPPTLAPIPASLPNTQSQSHDPGFAAVSNSSHFAPSSIGSSIPASRSTGDATFPRLHARGLVKTRNRCFANAVLQLLVNSPPSWNLFRELGDLKEQRGAGFPETGGGTTPLVDATVRFFKEFIVKDKSPSTQQQLQLAAGRTSRADEENKDDNVVDSFEPTYLYDAMKEKRQLKPLLVRSRAHVAASCY